MEQEGKPASDGLDVAYVAHLARLELTADEVALFQPQMDEIIGYVEKIAELDVSGVEPMSQAVEEANVWRADEPRCGLEHDRVMENAPRSAQGLFAVPKIVE